MKVDIPRRLMERLSQLSPAQRRAWLSKCRPQDLLLLDAAFEAWANDAQLEPNGEGWRVWLMMAGRGFGKTRAGAEWIHALALRGRKHIALVGATIDEARAVMVDGRSGLLSVARRQRVRIKWEPSLSKLSWPQGSTAQLFSGDNPDGLRGAEHHFAWGAATHRCAALSRRRRRSASRSAGKSSDRQMLPDRAWRNGGMGRTGRRDRLFHRGRLEICRASRRRCPDRQEQRRAMAMARRCLGSWNSPRPGSAHRWPTGVAPTPVCDRGPGRRHRDRRRKQGRGHRHSCHVESAWIDRLTA
ncbi:MAG TPA: terminase family protein [Sphingomicrobium sp.]|nr:terminase family protein [Sphingomicrobium sp.]